MRGRPVQNVGVQALLTVVFILLGLAIGSFLNVCIDRLPSGRSIVTPPSRCDQCQRRLAVADLIPVFSYLWLRGRCRYCGAVLPKRIVVVELVSGAVLGCLYLVFGLEVEFGVAAFWGCLFIVIFVIDLELGLVLNKIVYPSVVIALVFAALIKDLPWLEGVGAMEEWPQIAIAALGGGVGFLLFFLLALFAVTVLHKEGLGGGDVKLAALLGLVCGFPLILLVIVVGAMVGLLMALVMGRLKGGETIPFGSALVVATVVAMVAGQSIIDWLAGLYS
jgi:leader peptidase (prepilin peptidase)/N-methyltransferase